MLSWLQVANDDMLITSHIHEIINNTGRYGNHQTHSTLDRLDENQTGLTTGRYGLRTLGKDNRVALDPSWYQDQDLEPAPDHSYHTSQLGQDVVRNGDLTEGQVDHTRSQDSVPVTEGGMEMFGSLSQPAWNGTRSAELAVVKIKRHGKKSLELLTRSASSLFHSILPSFTMSVHFTQSPLP